MTEVDMIYHHEGGALRALFLGAMTDAYYEASEEERRSRILPRFKELVDEWRALGARVLATVDDDLFMVGEPRSTGYTFFLVLEVDRFDDVIAMIQRIRESVGGVRMDTYARFEARVGRPFFLLEEAPE